MKPEMVYVTPYASFKRAGQGNGKEDSYPNAAHCHQLHFLVPTELLCGVVAATNSDWLHPACILKLSHIKDETQLLCRDL